MSNLAARKFVFGAAILWALGSVSLVRAQIAIGTWTLQSDGAGGAGGMTMTVEACCNGGLKLSYRVAGTNELLLTVDSPMDGRDVPVMAAGKPTGETMGIKRLDDHHCVAVIKLNGKQVGTSKAALSADSRTLTVESDYTSAEGGQAVGKQTQIWTRK